MKFAAKVYRQLLGKIWRVKCMLSHSDEIPDQYVPQEGHFDSLDYLKQLNVAYCTHSERVIIEPQTGWAIKGREIVAESYPYWANINSGWPPLPSLIKYVNPFKKKRVIEKAVSFHYGWDNYYHFFADTLPQVKYWQAHGDPGLPWIVPKKVKHLKYVQDYLAIDNVFDGIQLVYQEHDEYIYIEKEAYFLKRSRFDCQELKYLIDRLLLKFESIHAKNEKKIFLIRKGYRTAINLPELIDVANDFGFETLATDNMSLEEQVRLFGNVRWLIGFHGAGLTNMIFRKDKKLSVLELFPKNKVPLHYWHLAIDFNYSYSYCTGNKYENMDENFYLDPNKFKAAIHRMQEEDPSLSL